MSTEDDKPVEQQPIFSIEKLYIKDASLEVPNAPQVFLNSTAPTIGVHIDTSFLHMEDGYVESILKVSVTAQIEERNVFLVEVTQGGIFRLVDIPAADMDTILHIACPNILFPYAREAISDLVTRAGFPPVILAPINFEQIHMQRPSSTGGIDVNTTLQ